MSECFLNTVYAGYYVGNSRVDGGNIMLCESWLEAEMFAKAHADANSIPGIDCIMLSLGFGGYINAMLEKEDGEWVRTYSEHLDTLGDLYDGGDE